MADQSHRTESDLESDRSSHAGDHAEHRSVSGESTRPAPATDFEEILRRIARDRLTQEKAVATGARSLYSRTRPSQETPAQTSGHENDADRRRNSRGQRFRARCRKIKDGIKEGFAVYTERFIRQGWKRL